MRSHQRMVLSNACALTGMLLALLLFAPDAFARPSAEPSGTPAALIKNIVIGNQERTEAKQSQAVVTRASGEEVSVSNGLMLYRGDLIETFAGTRVTILFLDAPVSERANEAIIDANARVAISSTDSWWGRIQVKIKGAFRSRSKYVLLSPRGTEYDFNVFKNEERSELIVLEEAVDSKEGDFPLVGAKQTSGLVPELRMFDTTSAANLFKAFAPGPAAQEQFGRALDVPSGRTAIFTFNFTISNSCAETHQFEFRTSSGTPWLQLTIAPRISIPGRSDRQIEGIVKADATNLTPGPFRGKVYAVCLDCAQERRCNKIQLEWPINLTVTKGATTTPTPESSQALLIRELEKVTFTRGVDQPVRAQTTDVISALNWTNDVILPAQPTYVARNLLPHFASTEQRSRNFRAARQDSILSKDKIGSHKILGDIYSDWDEGTRAFTVYEKELRKDRSQRGSASFMADLSEAYRATGKLKDARQNLNSIPVANQQSAPVRNAVGNLNLTEAEIALDEGNPERAKSFLSKAQDDYKAALQGQPTTRGRADRSDRRVTLQSNLGEVYLASGQIAQQQGQAAEARKQFDAAAQLFNPIQRANAEYPHPITDLGRAYQGLGRVAMLEGNVAEAKTAYARAETQHKQAIGAHPDFAEAYSNLGAVYVDLGDKEAAKDSYRRAIKARPEQPASYYSLALLVQDEDRQLAGALASVYLQLQPEAFKTGERARNAGRITRGEYVPPPKPVIPSNKDGSGGDNNNRTDAVVPDVVGKSTIVATGLIEDAGLRTGRVETRDSRQSPDTVLEQSPIAGQRATRGSTVNLVVAASSGQPEGGGVGNIKVPDVVDDKEDTARRKIEKKGLRVGQVTKRASCEQVGKVLEQNPRQDTKVGEGAVVDLVIGSIGADGVTVPSFKGRTRDDAEATIREMGLRLAEVKTEETDRPGEGKVLEQKPKSGTSLARGCPVEITVGIPIPYVDVDDYVGKTEKDARARLSDVGLRARTEYRPAEGNPGIVLAQDPQRGGRVRKGGYVTLVVSEAKQVQTVRVPDLFGKTREAAEDAIRQAGLKVGQVNFVVNANKPSGTVIGQKPAAGKEVPIGTTVDFEIAYVQIGED